MVRKVNCCIHGQQEETFVCQHLVESLSTGEKVGFYSAFEPRGDAWCSMCETVRVKEGGKSGDWNDKSEAFADIKLLCGSCYDQIRELNK